MATKSERERLATLEEQGKQNMVEHSELKTLVKEGNKELKDFIKIAATKKDLDGKADLEDFLAVKNNQITLNNRLWYLLTLIILSLIAGLGWTVRQLIMRGI